MAINIFLEDLVASAFIEILKKDNSERFVSFKTIDDYGAKLLNYFAPKRMFLKLGRDYTRKFFYEYSNYFVEAEKDGAKGIRLLDNVSREDLIRAFWGCIPYELVVAFNRISVD